MEIEAKFAVPNAETFERLQAVKRLGAFTLAAGQTKHVRDTYSDTADRTILAAGYACRRRVQDDGVLITLKGLGGAEGAVHRRDELEILLPEDLPPAEWPDSSVRDRVLQLTGKTQLIPLLELQQKRTVRPMRKNRRLVAELSLDEVQLTVKDEKQVYFELEAELTPRGTESDLTEVAAHLQEEWGLTPEPRSKFERALEALDEALPEPSLQKAKLPKAPGLDADDTMAEAARKTLYFHFLRMLHHEPGTRQGEDIEELHDMRVATRRMRAAFRVFGDYLDMGKMKTFLKGLRRTGRTLGAVRDLDVFWQKTRHYLETLSPERQEELEPLYAVWKTERERAREKMNAYLDSERYVQFKEQFGEFLRTPNAGALPPFSKKGEPIPNRLRYVVPVLVYQRLAAVRAYDEWVTGEDVSLERLHQLRIAAKGLRYTLEYFREILGPEAKDAIKEIKGLQDHLGDLQDAVVASSLLRDFMTWGTWGHAQAEEGARLPAEPIVAPGVAAYLAARQIELQRLVNTFPQTWVQIQSPDFGRLVAAALTTLQPMLQHMLQHML
jgi:CHAD domain-containing protein